MLNKSGHDYFPQGRTLVHIGQDKINVDPMDGVFVEMGKAILQPSEISVLVKRYLVPEMKAVLANARRFGRDTLGDVVYLLRLSQRFGVDQPFVKTYSNNPLCYPSLYNGIARFILDNPIYHGQFSYDNPLGCREYMPE